MQRRTKDERRVREIARRHPLYEDKHYVRVLRDNKDKDHIFITWMSTESRIEEQVVHLDLEIEELSIHREGQLVFEKTIILNGIGVDRDERGKGYGVMLYNMVEEIGRLFGCVRYEQTPSGWTHTGETRESWLLRRGFQKDGNVVFKQIGEA